MCAEVTRSDTSIASEDRLHSSDQAQNFRECRRHLGLSIKKKFVPLAALEHELFAFFQKSQIHGIAQKLQNQFFASEDR
jgi:hypothetical protein